jgi:hypothetical protein
MKQDDDKDVWDGIFSGGQINSKPLGFVILWQVISLPAYKEYGGMGTWMMFPVALAIWWIGRKPFSN